MIVDKKDINLTGVDTGTSPIVVFYQLSVASLDNDVTVFYAKIHYGFVPQAPSHVTSRAIVDNYGEASDTVTWNVAGLEHINALIPNDGFLNIIARCDFGCAPPNPCIATFGPALAELWYRKPVKG